ncbi:Rne/Rng family ribonuclease [Rhizobium laguerreae]|uniref:Rne/Rng family ribonuclease n=1 Tax=Rhizobium laguerreae TaxID=1076926 RepID=UPI001039DD03|nr:ribonuclease E/G [Rhizobium laguerreae]MBN9986041.1 Rne/Rng family ribonuclease [Rhizobium laguerreae]MBY3071404.1 Rne/Rng family ribonuclease [Rhizobium laguerreae]MBY3098138.1 Rne/Rng family ribonuclease [Rhizobium laguerreae]MBY3160790.1 Rne/Rng family ribonuclease [Rhizobium laguerreae]MBY3248275.1 Rne/Rng family ribonuclease [Rhizobium laguerreae]
MADKMLIDASHEEETRVVVVRGNRIEEFDFESQHKKQIRGNIYLAKVTRVEPSLQAAFVDYGGNRHGFLAFAEIHPDYYQIPLADRQALLRAEAEEHRRDEDVEHVETAPMVDLSKQDQPDVGIVPAEAPETAAVTEETAAVEAAASPEATEEAPAKKARPRRSRKKVVEPVVETTATEDAVPTDVEAEGASSVDNEDDGSTGGAMAAMVETDSISEDVDTSKRRHDDDDDDDDHGEEEVIESVGAEDAMEEVPDRVQRKPRKQYRIQEVIKRRQILLVQVAKEERGNKGAALTTYLSLAGRYSVLMPNTARGGGISRKITNPADRKRLKEIARLLEVPQGMGVILRTAGANRTKVEVKRDFEYLMRLWENVRTLTLASTAPCLVYEEGSLIKRSIRDLYNKDISEVIVSGEEGYREAKDFMKMLMPSHAKVVQPYRDIHPIFSRSGIEAQLDRMLQPQVTLKSGGYLIMNQTEALVSIDVNSGRSTREHSIEDTALQTNLEAADEVARQLRLRDLAGLIVIDFIDMEEKRNNRAVEKKLKECLKNDRARIQVGRISHFGLLEMSRQRIRASVLESTTQVCSHCGGSGHVRSQSSVALHVLRGIEEYLLKNTTHNITVRTTPDIALYLLNHKRQTIVDYESRFGVAIIIDADGSVGAQHFAIDRGEPVENPVKIETLFNFAAIPEDDDDDIVIEVDEEEDEELEEKPAVAERPVAARAEGEADGNRKRKRRRRRRGRNGNAEQPVSAGEAGDEDEEGDDEGGEGDENTEATPETRAESEESQRRKRRRRGKRGGRRNRAEDGSELTAGEAGEDNGDDEDEGDDVSNDGAPSEAVAVEAIAEQADEGQAAMAAVESAPVITEEVKPARARGRRKPAAAPVEEPVAETAPVAEAEPELVEASADLETSVQEEAKPVRANRESNISSSEPTVKSTRVENGEGDDGKPKKAGWWQRRGFF